MSTHEPDGAQSWPATPATRASSGPDPFAPPNPFAPPHAGGSHVATPAELDREGRWSGAARAPEEPTQPIDVRGPAEHAGRPMPAGGYAPDVARPGSGPAPDERTQPLGRPGAADTGPGAADTGPQRSWGSSSGWPVAAGVPAAGGTEPAAGRDEAPRRRPRALTAAWLAPLLVLSLLAGALGGVLADRTLGGGRLADAGLPVQVSSDAPARPAASIAGIAATVLPSVVSIEVTSPQGRATGSGFVLRQDGYLLTNNHVIAPGTHPGSEIRVLFADGSEETATIVGRTSDYDLAVLKVERTGLDPLLLADSSAVTVGDAVVAIGAPLGLEGTVTTGIVSAMNRPVQAGASGETAFINAIQTDAAINPGNSGGPLVNESGEVVGINSAIAQPPGGLGAAAGSIGLGFAIPSNQARRTAEELIETGRATYPIIGVLLDERYTGEGVQVSAQPAGPQAAVTAGGPADDAGILPGDVIVAIDGRPVTEPDELIVSIRAKAPGDVTVLRVRTGDDERDVRVVLDEATSE